MLYNRASADPDGKPWSERKSSCGGTTSEGSGRASTCRTSRRTKPPDYVPPDGAEARGCDRRRPPVHHAGRRPRAGSSSRRGSRTGRCRRTTSRTSRRSTTRSTRSARTRARQQLERAENPYNPVAGEPGGERLPVRRDHLPADRAPHGGRHVAHRAVPRRAAARRCSARCPPSSPRERGLEHGGWATIYTARVGDRGARARHRPDPPLRRRAARSTRSACRTTGAGGASRPATPRTTSRTWRSTRTSTSRRSRRSRAGSVRAGGRGRALPAFVADLRSGRTRGARGRGEGTSDVSALHDHRMPAAADTYGDDAQERVGFFTDTSVCIGCKACEVACKEWNLIPEDGLVWTGESTTTRRRSARTRGATSRSSSSRSRCGRRRRRRRRRALRWLMESDVCKHCTHAACLDVCPTGSLFRTEFGTVVVQEDICNGCGYCVPACPFGVLDKRHLAAMPTSRRPTAAARQEGRRARLEVHALLRPAEGRARAGLREGVPDGLDPVRPARRVRERADERLGKLAGRGLERRAALRPRPGRRRRRLRRVLPAARRARGLRAAARSGRHDASTCRRCGDTAAAARRSSSASSAAFLGARR